MTQQSFPSPREVLDTLLLPLVPEDRLIEDARERLKQSHPNGPVDWAIRYAQSNTNRVTKNIPGPLGSLVRKAVLREQLKSSETYLASMTEFLELENPKDEPA